MGAAGVGDVIGVGIGPFAHRRAARPRGLHGWFARGGGAPPVRTRDTTVRRTPSGLDQPRVERGAGGEVDGIEEVVGEQRPPPVSRNSAGTPAFRSAPSASASRSPSARIASRTATSLTPGLRRFDFTQDDPQVGEVDLAVGAGFVGLT